MPPACRKNDRTNMLSTPWAHNPRSNTRGRSERVQSAKSPRLNASVQQASKDGRNAFVAALTASCTILQMFQKEEAVYLQKDEKKIHGRNCGAQRGCQLLLRHNQLPDSDKAFTAPHPVVISPINAATEKVLSTIIVVTQTRSGKPRTELQHWKGPLTLNNIC
ncbi:hypothetical protein CC80DRAFT_533842 [Byssothecium circinans]|uniref:Uncharacterized protein n=1 Tax=Byssothecium circinans TaxID=147558 RepID=A0A6A5U2J3_9PLEO|nr:hypothetical protein CC80DRAFT_533842 [Byssothecium circinans]